MARADGLRRAAPRLPGLRFGLGALRLPLADTTGLAATLAMAGAAGMVFVRLALVRWRSFETNAFDLAFFDQIIHNTSRGRWFETSFTGYNFAGQHLEPVLLVFVPAYWLGAGPLVLTVTQAVVASVAAIPLYFMARRLGHSNLVAVAAVSGYLVNPYLHRALAIDFHPEVMVALPAFSAAWATAAGRLRLAIPLALSVLLFKEDAAFVALGLAGMMFSLGHRRAAVATTSIATLYAGVAVLAIMPAIRGGAESDLVERYGYLLGDGSLPSTAGVPFRAAAQIASLGPLATGLAFIAASAGLCLIRPALVVFLVPGLLLPLLSTHPPQNGLELHYAAGLVPVAILMSVLAARETNGRWRGAVAALLVLPPLFVALLWNPLGEGHGEAPSDQHRQAVEAALRLVPRSDDVAVSAQSGLLPRLSQRRQAHEFPGGLGRAQWVVVDRYGFRSSQSIAAGFDAQLAEVRDSMTPVFSRDGVEVFRRVE